jgi:hypothetical protein
MAHGARRAVLARVRENLPLVRRPASGQRILYWSIGIAFARPGRSRRRILISSSVIAEPLLLVADLLHALVPVVFVEIYEEASVPAGARCVRAAVGRPGRAGGRQAGPGRRR